MAEQSIRVRLRDSNSGPWFNKAARLLTAYVSDNAGAIPVKRLGKVGPGFHDLTVGFAEIRGFLDAALVRRESYRGDWLVAAEMGEDEARAAIDASLEGGKAAAAAKAKARRAETARPPGKAAKVAKPKPGRKPADKAATPPAKKAAASEPAPEPLLQPDSVGLNLEPISAVAEDAPADKAATPSPDRSRRRVGWREAHLRRNARSRKQRASADMRNPPAPVQAPRARQEGDPVPAPKKAKPRRPRKSGKPSWKLGTSRESQFLDLLSKRPMFGTELVTVMDTSRQNVNFLAHRLLREGKISTMKVTSNSTGKLPNLYRLSDMPVRTAKALLKEAGIQP